MTPPREDTILLVSDDASLCAAAREAFETKEAGLRVSAVCTVDAARRIVEDSAPVVILLEQSSLVVEGEGRLAKVPALNTVVSFLAVHAPVVVIGAADQQSELAFLVEAGAADFVERAGGCLPIAFKKVEGRVRHARQTGIDAQGLNNVSNGVAQE